MKLPADLLAFYRQCNGFQLAIAKDETRGFIELLPLRNVVYAPRVLYGETTAVDAKYPPSFYALAPDIDCAQVLVLDTATGEYYDVDPIAGIEEDGKLGRDWCDALRWICSRVNLV